MTEISRSYADALFSLAAESGSIEQTLDSLRLARNELYATEGALELLASPAIPKDERLRVLEDAFGDTLPEHVLSLLCVMCANGHIRELDDCVTVYVELHDAAMKLSTAKVTSAVPLTEAEQAAIIAKLNTRQAGLSYEWQVDSSLIAGLTVKVGDNVTDASVRTRIENLTKTL